MSIMRYTIKQSCTTTEISDFIKANKDASDLIPMHLRKPNHICIMEILFIPNVAIKLQDIDEFRMIFELISNSTVSPIYIILSVTFKVCLIAVIILNFLLGQYDSQYDK